MEDNESIKALIRKTYNSSGSIGQKIQGLISTRKEYEGNDEIQKECNKYLDKLYNRKYQGEERKEVTNESLANKIRVVIKKPNKQAQVYNIEDTLETYQELVEGYIESIELPTNENVQIVLNEEGKLRGLKRNINCPEYKDILVGTLVFVGIDWNTGEYRSLSASELNDVIDYISSNDLRESLNTLKDMHNFNKKRQKGLSPFTKLDAGDVEKGNAIFNQAMGASEGSGLGEDLEETYNSVRVVVTTNATFVKYFNFNKPVTKDIIREIRRRIFKLGDMYVSDIPEYYNAVETVRENLIKPTAIIRWTSIGEE